uniref:Prefoldin subunit 2 n=1 Tax=Salix viminalis TaxID=40686 RepID=A0A6N2NHW5_SALVM
MAEGDRNEPINEQVVANMYSAMRNELNQIYSKITELEMDVSEHSLVINAIQPLDPSRRCYRMIGGVLVERTIKEVLPAVLRNKEGIEEVIARLNEAAERKKKEISDFEAKYKIRIRKSDGEVKDDANKKEGSSQGVLVGPAGSMIARSCRGSYTAAAKEKKIASYQCHSMTPQISLIFFLNKGNGVKGLSEMGLESLPKENIQPLEERKCDTKSCSQNPFPSLACQNGMTLKLLKQSVKLQGNGDSFRLLTIEYLRMLRKHLISSSGYHLRRRGKYPKELSPSNNVRFGSNFSPEAEKALEWKDYLSFMSPRMRLLRLKLLNVTEMDETKESLLLGSKRINLNYYPICPDPELTFVINPRPSDKISSFPEALSSGEKAVYNEVLYWDYAKHFFLKALDGKKNSRCRKHMV